MRPVPATLVVDASILIAALLGRSGELIVSVADHAALITTDRAIQEAARRIELGLRRPGLLAALGDLTTLINVFEAEPHSQVSARAALTLQDAVPSRNGSTRDAHLLALAWQAEAEIWTHDRDFAGAGVASWSTFNLLAAIDQAQAA